MTGKERVKASLNHHEPDRVPMMEVAAGNTLASKVLGRQVNIFFSGDAIKNLVIMNMDATPGEKKDFAVQGYIDQLEFFDRMGIDGVPVMPGAYVLNTINPFGHSGMNDNQAVEVEKIEKNAWKIKDEHGFWSVVKYVPESDTAVISDHCLRYNGEKELKRLVKIWKNKDYSKPPAVWQAAVDAMKVLKDQPAYKDHYIMGYADILPPFLEPWAGLFLELVILNPSLVFDYLELQAEGWYTVLKAELGTGVMDGVFGSMDFCFKSGCLVSPKHFKQLFAPGLKRIVDLVHSHNMKYIKHCDGNVLDILDIMVDYCGIDALQPIEPTDDNRMTLGWLKKNYGEKISLCGNIDCGKMVNWTAEEIEEEVKKAIKIAAPGGGYLISSSNALHSGIPPENAFAYTDAVKKWGSYPINIE
jgi:hypothetical protein